MLPTTTSILSPSNAAVNPCSIIQPRDYQQAAVENIVNCFKDDVRSVLLILTTGLGKTICFSLAIKKCRGRSLVLAHREELVDQAAKKVEAITGKSVSIEMADRNADPDAGIIVASVQSLANRLTKYPRKHFTFVVTDECHHATANIVPAIDESQIPELLKGLEQWVLWVWRQNNGKPTKVPLASSNDPTTWTTFELACYEFRRQTTCSGIDFMFSATDDSVGIDFDACRNPETGKLLPFAEKWIKRFNSYSEVSPSQTGVKVWIRGKKPGTRCKVKNVQNVPCIECYEMERYFTVTSQRLDGCAAEVHDRQGELDEFYREVFGADDKNSGSKAFHVCAPNAGPRHSIDVVIELLRAKGGLPWEYFCGSPSGDNSNDDWCLVSAIVEIVGPYADLVDAVIRESELINLGNGKWDSKRKDSTYGRDTIEKAILELGNRRDKPTDSSDKDSNVISRNKPQPPMQKLLYNEGYMAELVIGHLGNLGWASPWLPKRIHEQVKIYDRGGTLVQLIQNENGIASAHAMHIAILRERITQACTLYSESKNIQGNIETTLKKPPKWLVDAIFFRRRWGSKIRPLYGIVTAPTLRPDGSILQKKGYDAQTSFIYATNQNFPQISEFPTRDDARQAVHLLEDVVCDFPFLNDANRSAWFAFVLTMLSRPCIEGVTPLFATTANLRGTGKSMLSDVATLIALGRLPARRVFTSNDEEQRKAITSIVLEATPNVLFDNLNEPLAGAALDAVLTGETWNDRLLGHSKTTGDIPVRTVWSATGNNMSFGTDLGRRVLPICLECHDEKPELRTNFKRPNLVGWIKENRPQLVAAALTVIRAYFVAGCPEQSGGIWGSFENWSRIVRGSLVWAGCDDPLTTREYVNANDNSVDVLDLLIAGLEEIAPHGEPITTGRIQQKLSFVGQYEALEEAVSEVCGDRFNARQFGRTLKDFKGRVRNGKKIRGATADTQDGQLLNCQTKMKSIEW